MSKSTLDSAQDNELFGSLRFASRWVAPNRNLRIAKHVQQARDLGWSWSLIAYALRFKSASSARYYARYFTD